jgi:hypothetical protein
MNPAEELKKIADQLDRKASVRYLDWAYPEDSADLYNAGWVSTSWEERAPEVLQDTKMQKELAKFGLEIVLARIDEECAYWQIAKKGEQFTQPY